jgi:hypothetical protein
MKPFRRLTAWLARKRRTRERRKLHCELIRINRLRQIHPERHDQFSADTSSILALLNALDLADDMAGIEARLEPLPLWPGLPTEGPRLRAVQGGRK